MVDREEALWARKSTKYFSEEKTTIVEAVLENYLINQKVRWVLHKSIEKNPKESFDQPIHLETTWSWQRGCCD